MRPIYPYSTVLYNRKEEVVGERENGAFEGERERERKEISPPEAIRKQVTTIKTSRALVFSLLRSTLAFLPFSTLLLYLPI